MQAPSSRIPPRRAAAVTSDLYKPCACLHEYSRLFYGDCQSLLTDSNRFLLTSILSEFAGNKKMMRHDINYRMGQESGEVE